MPCGEPITRGEGRICLVVSQSHGEKGEHAVVRRTPPRWASSPPPPPAPCPPGTPSTPRKAHPPPRGPPPRSLASRRTRPRPCPLRSAEGDARTPLGRRTPTAPHFEGGPSMRGAPPSQAASRWSPVNNRTMGIIRDSSDFYTSYVLV
eukprot:1187258-Prorocentrum_minimum.AAC.1